MQSPSLLDLNRDKQISEPFTSPLKTAKFRPDDITLNDDGDDCPTNELASPLSQLTDLPKRDTNDSNGKIGKVVIQSSTPTLIRERSPRLNKSSTPEIKVKEHGETIKQRQERQELDIKQKQASTLKASPYKMSSAKFGFEPTANHFDYTIAISKRRSAAKMPNESHSLTQGHTNSLHDAIVKNVFEKARPKSNRRTKRSRIQSGKRGLTQPSKRREASRDNEEQQASEALNHRIEQLSYQFTQENAPPNIILDPITRNPFMPPTKTAMIKHNHAFDSKAKPGKTIIIGPWEQRNSISETVYTSMPHFDTAKKMEFDSEDK